MVVIELTGIEYVGKSWHPSKTCRWLWSSPIGELTVILVHIVMWSARVVL